MGNEKANELYEYTLEPAQKPKESDSAYVVEAFIRDKYERKKWMRPAGKSAPSKSSSRSKNGKDTKHDSDDEDSEEERRTERRRARRKKREAEKEKEKIKAVTHCTAEAHTACILAC